MTEVEKQVFQTHRCTRCHKLIYWYKGMTAGEFDTELAKHAREEGITSMTQYIGLFELILDVPILPEPDTQEWEDMVEVMREDLESGTALAKIEAIARKIVADRGGDFAAEFAEWRKKYGKERNRESWDL